MTKEIYNKIYSFTTHHGKYMFEYGLNDYALNLQDTKKLFQILFENQITILGFDAWELLDGMHCMKGEFGWACKNGSDYFQSYIDAIETLSYFKNDGAFEFTVQCEGEEKFLVRQNFNQPA